MRGGVEQPGNLRRGSVLVEFALVALASYLLLAGIITFGYLLYVAQGLQQAADVAARELSRTPLPANITFEEALESSEVRQRVFSEDFLVVDITETGFVDAAEVATWPILNQQLFPLMIVDFVEIDGVRRRLFRYPGALLRSETTPTGLTVGVPMVVSRDESGVETIRWVPLVEEIEPADPNDPRHDPFRITSEHHGLVALRLNYPFQSPVMSSFRPNPNGPHPDPRFNPTIGSPNVAADGAVGELNEAPGELFLPGAVPESGTHGGTYGMGAQAALGSQELTGGLPVRPFRRLLSAQAVYRREVFGP